MPSIAEIPVQRSVTVAATTTHVLTENPNRFYYFIRNLSTGGQVITLGKGQDAIAGSGIVLLPGEYDQLSPLSVGGIENVFKGRIEAIASTVGGILAIEERSM